MTDLTPKQQIEACKFILSEKGKTKTAAVRLLRDARTEQLKQECAPKMHFASERRV